MARVFAPGPYSALRDAVISDHGAIRETIMSRSAQTNEVGRLATLMPALDTMAWLRTTGQRRQRLVDAITIARQDPPALIAGDLLEALPAEIDTAAEHGVVVVFHSAVIAYLNDPPADASGRA
jgi:hypothetical protein